MMKNAAETATNSLKTNYGRKGTLNNAAFLFKHAQSLNDGYRKREIAVQCELKGMLLHQSACPIGKCKRMKQVACNY